VRVDQRIQRGDRHRRSRLPDDAAKGRYLGGLSYPSGIQRADGRMTVALVEPCRSRRGADRLLEHRHLRVVAVPAPQKRGEFGLRFQRHHPRAERPPAAYAAAGVGADVEAQAAGRDERTVHRPHARGVPGAPVVDRQRSGQPDRPRDPPRDAGRGASLRGRGRRRWFRASLR